MARRRIGQESLAFTAREPGRNAALDELAAAIDWAPLAKVLDGIYAARRRGRRWRCSRRCCWAFGTTFRT